MSQLGLFGAIEEPSEAAPARKVVEVELATRPPAVPADVCLAGEDPPFVPEPGPRREVTVHRRLSLSDGRPMPGTRLLWEAAGRPRVTGDGDVEAHDGWCWWCGERISADLGRHMGLGRPIKRAVANTFPDAMQAARPDATHLCMACGWCWSDKVALPAELAAERIAMKAKAGRRAVVTIEDGDPERVLILELADGTIGVWETGPNARAEKPWQDARKDLAENPRDVEPCTYRGSWPLSAFSDAPAEKSRCFHHLATLDPPRWMPRTDSHRAEIRAFLLDPPAGPWLCSIGDGQKHHTEYARANTGNTGGLWVAYIQRPILYRPEKLAALLDAIEALIVAGANDDEIRTGEYGPRGMDLMLAVRRHDATVREFRGGPLMDVALYLRRNRKELGC